ncbi:MAG TPA: dihydrodipicolinate synthase family protein [Gaiellaceae bacterium]|nr:dihydrodipicolinate synthase family protein [Gaiellaceae bacterium]
MSLKGALAAAVTPYRANGSELDDGAFEGYAEFLHAGGVGGVLAGGTTGEGILQTPEERIRGISLFAGAGLTTIAHCGAQTTADTVRLAAAAGEAGAAAVAVIAPPYFRLDDRALLAHFEAAAAACAPLPFYVYEFQAASGYAASIEVVSRLRDRAPNYVGLKVSDAPWERFAPYLLEGLDVFVGPEALIAQGMAAGAVGAVSGLAAAFPDRVTAAVARPDGPDAAVLGELRAFVERFPRHAALKRILQRRGVSMTGDVRRPLRQLTHDERDVLDAWIDAL